MYICAYTLSLNFRDIALKLWIVHFSLLFGFLASFLYFIEYQVQLTTQSHAFCTCLSVR